MFDDLKSRGKYTRDILFYICSVYQIQIMNNREFTPEEWIEKTKLINQELRLLNRALYKKLEASHPDNVKGIDISVFDRDAITMSGTPGKSADTFFTPFESAILYDFHLCQLKKDQYYTVEEIFFYADGLLKENFAGIEDLGKIDLTYGSIRREANKKFLKDKEAKMKNMN